MKECCNCKKLKKETEFGKLSKSLDGLQYKCKTCKKDYDKNYHSSRSGSQINKKRDSQKKRRKDNRKEINKYLKDNPCKCGESRLPCLDFHHLNDKKFNISSSVNRGVSLKKIFEEIKKCLVLCANCHRIETAREFNWYK